MMMLVLVGLSACGSGALLDNVSLDPDGISPFAGSPNAATVVRYTVTRNADVSIYLLDAQGNLLELVIVLILVIELGLLAAGIMH